MADISPAAQAVLDAYHATPIVGVFPQDADALGVAAALRAAASALRNAYANEQYVDSADDFLDDIAAELEAHQC
jgi:hypothetical protein